MNIPLDRVWAIEEHAAQTMFSAVTSDRLIQAIKVEAKVQTRPERVGSLAIVNLVGPLTKQPSLFTELFGGTSTRAARFQVEDAASDPEVKNILLRIDSPGGSVDGMSELSDAIYGARQRKPVVAQVDGMMLSGGLWAGAQASRIFAGDMDMVGSIGTRLMLWDFSEAFEKAGVKALPIDTGEFKSAGAMGTVVTDRQKAEFQGIVNEFQTHFNGAVARGRGMAETRVKALATGAVWIGKQGVDVGLVDGIQTLDQTVDQLTN